MTLPNPVNTASPGRCHLVLAIPARFGSTRLRGKPLLPLGGKTMIECVAARALEAARAARARFGSVLGEIHVLVATDHEGIFTAARSAGARAVLTHPDLPSGTDRIHAAVEALASEAALGDDALVVNVQGDEPFFSVDDVLNLVGRMIARPEARMGTLAFSRDEAALFFKSSVVKVESNAEGEAIAFSRAPLPWPRASCGAAGLDWIATLAAHAEEGFARCGAFPFLHHIGIYAFRRSALSDFATRLPPSALEEHEGLEQLRALDAGWKILVERAVHAPFGVDTPEDLAEATRRWEELVGAEART